MSYFTAIVSYSKQQFIIFHSYYSKEQFLIFHCYKSKQQFLIHTLYTYQRQIKYMRQPLSVQIYMFKCLKSVLSHDIGCYLFSFHGHCNRFFSYLKNLMHTTYDILLRSFISIFSFVNVTESQPYCDMYLNTCRILKVDCRLKLTKNVVVFFQNSIFSLLRPKSKISSIKSFVLLFKT